MFPVLLVSGLSPVPAGALKDTETKALTAPAPARAAMRFAECSLANGALARTLQHVGVSLSGLLRSQTLG